MIVRSEMSLVPQISFHFHHSKYNNQIRFFIRHFRDLKLPLDVTPFAIRESLFSKWPFK